MAINFVFYELFCLNVLEGLNKSTIHFNVSLKDKVYRNTYIYRTVEDFRVAAEETILNLDENIIRKAINSTSVFYVL